MVRTCLAKDPDDRFQTAHDVRLQLQWIAEGGSQVGVPAPVAARRKGRERVAWGAAAAATLAALILGFLFLTRTREPLHTVSTSILSPEKTVFDFGVGPMTLSPDGRRLAFVASTQEGRGMLWVRPLDASTAQPLAGTENATYPFWSPDSRFLGFFANGKLKKIDATGGPAQTLSDATNGRGGTWSREGVIVFSPSARDALLRVSSAGGVATPVSELDVSKREYTHRFPSFLPDGRHVLFLAQAVAPMMEGGPHGVYVCSLDGKERKLIVRVNSNAVYAPASRGGSEGYLLYARDRSLLAQPFDAKGLRTTGEAFPVGEAIQFFSNFGYSVFSASESGALAFQSGGSGAMSQLAWFDRAGKEVEVVGAQAEYLRPRVSHDGRRIAVDISDPKSGYAEIWVHDLARRVSTRFTFEVGGGAFPLWSADDSRIVFNSNRGGAGPG